MPRPFTLIAELTYRCPLRCPYCSNPPAPPRDELPAETWERVIDEAEALGVVQLHLTGGEPLLYRDVPRLVARGRAREMYVNLVTSGVGLSRDRLAALRDAGLDHVQVSFQDADRASSDAIAGVRVFERKLVAARMVRELGLPLTINVVLHRDNLDHVADIIALAEQLGADRLELANAQYLGHAFAHRDALVPSRDQLERAFSIATAARDRHVGTMEVIFVKPDYFTGTPRACMDGWANTYIHVTPAGRVLPCHAAEAITTLDFDRVTDRSLAEIWETSPALARFRGHDWMTDPCRSCDRRELDHGGCRCQAFLLAGDAAAADPACSRAPRHDLVQLRAGSRARAFVAQPSMLDQDVSDR
jgi:pyrroloquinoline quinone biosynthesis protein E